MNDVPMQTLCVGRMLVDLPKGKQHWQQQFDYAKVSKLPAVVNTKKAFDGYVRKRKVELAEKTEDNPSGRIFKYRELASNQIVIMFRPERITHSYIHTERYVWDGENAYKYETGTLGDEQGTILISRVEEIPDHVLPIQNTDPPDKSGFCIDSALVTGDIGPIWSSASVDIKQWNGVSVNAGAREDDGSRDPLPWQKDRDNQAIPTAFDDLGMMKEWADESRKTNDRGRVIVFNAVRKRERELAGFVGQEIAVRMELANGQEYYKFEWDTVDGSGKLSTPGLSLSLTAGADYATSDYQTPPDEDNLLALWDAMLVSLKRRPGAR